MAAIKRKTPRGEVFTLPHQFGRYRLTKLLAVGGMAQIYLGKSYGAEGFVKPLVIKRLDPNLGLDTHFTRLFINEAKLLVSLNHSNIAPVFDFGRVEGDLYMAMEYVRGATLHELMGNQQEQNRRLDPQLSAYIIAEICKGLDYAHRKSTGVGDVRGIIHRDVKPRNILLSDEGEVKLVDFGVAKLAGRMEAARLTGTLAYMSPEQAARKNVDAGTDIFSAGLVLHELLAGEPAYQGDSASELFSKARDAKVPPLPSDVPAELREVVAHATHFERGERFPSAHEMEAMLSEYLLLARSVGATVDSRSPASRLSILIRTFPQDHESSLDDDSLPDEKTLQELPESEPVEDAGPVDMAMIHDAAETFHTEFMTRVLAEQQADTTFQSSRRRWPLIALLILLVGLSASFFALWSSPTSPAKKPQDLSASKDATTPVPDATQSKAALDQQSSPDTAAPRVKPKTRPRPRPRPRGYGTLNLNSIPWSQVTINGRRIKRPTPLLRLKLRAGRHRIVLVNRERRLRKVIRVTIRSGQTTTKLIRLR
ncbi:MAG: serine/threonine protein kinase [Deltaproteobacteria bacterium]|nr:serine/threonine protein kinase [Deltaproteobacteria bacterium]